MAPRMWCLTTNSHVSAGAWKPNNRDCSTVLKMQAGGGCDVADHPSCFFAFWAWGEASSGQ
jgi:hypothetical protein